MSLFVERKWQVVEQTDVLSMNLMHVFLSLFWIKYATENWNKLHQFIGQCVVNEIHALVAKSLYGDKTKWPN